MTQLLGQVKSEQDCGQFSSDSERQIPQRLFVPQAKAGMSLGVKW